MWSLFFPPLLYTLPFLIKEDKRKSAFSTHLENFTFASACFLLFTVCENVIVITEVHSRMPGSLSQITETLFILRSSPKTNEKC